MSLFHQQVVFFENSDFKVSQCVDIEDSFVAESILIESKNKHIALTAIEFQEIYKLIEQGFSNSYSWGSGEARVDRNHYSIELEENDGTYFEMSIDLFNKIHLKHKENVKVLYK